jgi:methyl-accepting chemotaxis protein
VDVPAIGIPMGIAGRPVRTHAGDMTQSVPVAAGLTTEIANEISTVAQKTGVTAENAGDGQRSAAELSQLSRDIHELVSRFRY